MKKYVFFLSVIALTGRCAFAIDGVVLINQSTITAAGGFPYIINQPGSYKLSGNVTMSTTPTGNYLGVPVVDLAIGIASSNVTLDLNGFTINIVNNISTLTHHALAISQIGTLTGTVIQNGHITLTGTGSMSNV